MTKPKAKSPRAFAQAVNARLILITQIWIFVRIAGYICLNIAQIARHAKAPLTIIALNVGSVAWATCQISKNKNAVGALAFVKSC